MAIDKKWNFQKMGVPEGRTYVRFESNGLKVARNFQFGFTLGLKVIHPCRQSIRPYGLKVTGLKVLEKRSGRTYVRFESKKKRRPLPKTGK